jgi:hypothetical protein
MNKLIIIKKFSYLIKINMKLILIKPIKMIIKFKKKLFKNFN